MNMFWLLTVVAYISCTITNGDKLFLYEKRAQYGASKTLNSPTSNFIDIDFNDVVSSVACDDGDWELYTDVNYKGSRMVVREGDLSNAEHNNQYSSGRPICNYVKNPSIALLKVWEHSNLGGIVKEFFVGVGNLGDVQWDARISSVYAEKGDWEFYEYENFEGRRELVQEGQQINLQRNDLYNSLRPLCETYSAIIPQLVVYADSGFRGRSRVIQSPTLNFVSIGFNDVVSSVSAVKGNWELYTGKDFAGSRMVITEGQKSDADHNDEYSSTRPVCTYVKDPSKALLKVWEHSNQGGDVKEFFVEEGNLQNVQWNDKISSVYAEKGNWELYEHKNFQGRRHTVMEGHQRNLQTSEGSPSSLRPICDTV